MTDTDTMKWCACGCGQTVRSRFVRGHNRGVPPTDPAERFWRFVEMVPFDTCWFWTGSMAPNGYGSFKAGGRTVKAHRFAYELLCGPIPSGLVIDHLCRVRSCVNPAHMEAVTDRVNVVVRGRGPSAVAAHASRCQNGHPYTPENTRSRSDGACQCIACRREAERRSSSTRPARRARRKVA